MFVSSGNHLTIMMLTNIVTNNVINTTTNTDKQWCWLWHGPNVYHIVCNYVCLLVTLWVNGYSGPHETFRTDRAVALDHAVKFTRWQHLQWDTGQDLLCLEPLSMICTEWPPTWKTWKG